MEVFSGVGLSFGRTVRTRDRSERSVCPGSGVLWSDPSNMSSLVVPRFSLRVS